MNPPIASPHEPSRPNLPITKRVEWDAERDCFVIRYASAYRGRLRCEIYTGLRNPMGFLGATVGLPLTALLIGITTLAQRAKRANEFAVYAWGFQDAATEMTLKTEWKNLKKSLLHRGDFIAWRRSLLVPGCYLCRENFADEAEAQRLQQIVELLHENEGANWETVKAQFRR